MYEAKPFFEKYGACLRMGNNFHFVRYVKAVKSYYLLVIHYYTNLWLKKYIIIIYLQFSYGVE